MAGRMRGEVEEPEGLRYLPSFLTPTEEAELLAEMEGLDYGEVRMRGQVARRVVRHYGLSYAFETAALAPGEPVPEWLWGVREQCAGLLGRAAEELAEVLVTRYPPGATIGWHRDAPPFGIVVGVSLLSACRFRFRRTVGDAVERAEIELAPRSAYVLDGAARSEWQHSIPPTKALRYSITFRTLRKDC